MGRSHNDKIVTFIAWVCKFVIVMGCIFGFAACAGEEDKSDRVYFAMYTFAAVIVCHIFVWIARDPTLED